MPRAVLANTIYGKLHFVGRPAPMTLISFDAKTQVNICRRSSLGIHIWGPAHVTTRPITPTAPLDEIASASLAKRGGG